MTERMGSKKATPEEKNLKKEGRFRRLLGKLFKKKITEVEMAEAHVEEDGARESEEKTFAESADEAPPQTALKEKHVPNIDSEEKPVQNKALAKYLRKKARKEAEKAEAAKRQAEEEAQRPREPTFAELFGGQSDEEVQASIQEKLEGAHQPQKPRAQKRQQQITSKQILQEAEKLDARDGLPTVDLHQHSREEAILVAERTIEENIAEDQFLLCIVTGKGLHSENGSAVIRPAIHEMLAKYKRTGTIKDFINAPPKYGGGGAVIVVLR